MEGVSEGVSEGVREGVMEGGEGAIKTTINKHNKNFDAGNKLAFYFKDCEVKCELVACTKF